ncbi:MAG: response regulator [Verrucomicrobia bacterium]|nr:response regulator [Verrucomicrobiota bacterium]
MSSSNLAGETQIFRRLGPKPASAARSPFALAPTGAGTGARAVAQLRHDLHLFMRQESVAQPHETDARRLAVLLDMYEVLHSLTEGPARWESRAAATLARALESYTEELQAEPDQASASAMRTLAQGIDLLANLLERHTPGLEEVGAAPFVLVVDDEPLSRRLAKLGLERAGLAHISLDSSTEAAELLQRQRFDLVLLDMHMPDLDGCELCRRMRKMAFHAATPAVFVTGQNDLKARAQASLSGGTDFIGKPFHCGELAVKALGHILRARSPRPLGDTAIFTLAGVTGSPAGTNASTSPRLAGV